MVFTYAIYENGEMIDRKVVYHEYRKPALVGMYSVMLLLKEIPELKSEPVEVIVNDGALIEQINGTTSTKNKDVLKVAELTRKQIAKYGDRISIHSVAGNYQAKLEWESKLQL